MIIRSMELETVRGIISKLPGNTHPEFAFAGKSNAGRSSLISTSMNRKSYVRTSSQPGKTQTINFYHISDALYYVDLPGYGYAKVTLAVKEKWRKTVKNYPQESPMLKMVFPLISIRHEPPASDEMMYDWAIHNGYRPVIVTTKFDKINHSQVRKHVRMLRTGSGMRKEDVLIPLSAGTKQGREETWELVEGQMVD